MTRRMQDEINSTFLTIGQPQVFRGLYEFRMETCLTHLVFHPFMTKFTFKIPFIIL